MSSSSPFRALAGRAWSASRRGAVIWGLVFAVLIMSTALGYESSYGTAAERLHLASSLAGNVGIEALFGQVRDLQTAEGFVAWRSAGVLVPIAAIWGLLTSTRLLRGEEDGGRWEIALAGAIAPARATRAVLAALGGAALAVWALAAAAALVFGSAMHGFPPLGSLYLALALVSPAVVFMAVGALASQLAASRRQAIAIGMGVFGASLILRMAADSSVGVGWLRWATPLGWVEALRPFTGAQPLALLPIAALVAACVAATLRIAAGRDLGASLLASGDAGEPNLTLLGSTTGQALRAARGALLGWASGICLAAFCFGLISKTVADSFSGSSAVRAAHDYGSDVTTAAGYLGLTFLFLVVVVCLYGANQLAAIREEEALGRTEELFALPVTRTEWLSGRLGIAIGGILSLGLLAAIAGWIGARVGGAGLGIDELVLAGLNAFPIGILFLGLGTLAFAVVPRETATAAFGLVALTFLLAVVGETLRAPGWVLDLSPFYHLGVVPGGSIKVLASLVMLAVGAAAGIGGMALFERRDTVGP